MAPPNVVSVAPLQDRISGLLGPDGEPIRSEIGRRAPDPADPLTPELPSGAVPRAFVPFAGYNVSLTPRSEARALTPFQTLRALADSCDAARIIMEDLKGQISGFSWSVKPKKGVSQSLTGEIAQATLALRTPDGRHDFETWLTSVLEEILVIDALTMYRWRREDGTPLGLHLIDGATIKPLVDSLGLSPPPPLDAYQQVVWGRPETGYTRPWGDADPFDPNGDRKVELVYAPRNTRTWTPYGQSPLERFLMTMNIILRRQVHYLSWYTEGSIPEGFWKMPEGFTAEQVKRAQEIFDLMLAGESGQRQRLRFMLGGAGTGFESARQHDEWQFQFEEFLYRVASWAFQVSPLPVVMQMNRATSQQAEQAASDSGTKPLLKFIARLMTRELEQFWGWAGLEFIWTADKDEDARLKHERRRDWLDRGVLKIPEVREEEGRDPGEDIPPFINTSTGPLLVTAESIAAFSDFGPPAPTNGGNGTPGSTESDDSAAAVLDQAPQLSAAARAELGQWRRYAMRHAPSEKRVRPFVSKHVPGGLARALTEWLDHGHTVDDVAWAFHHLVRARRPLVSARRRIRLERRVRRLARNHFNPERREAVAEAALDAFRLAKVLTADEWQKQSDFDKQIDRALDWEIFRGDIESPLHDAFLDGEVLAANAGRLDVEFGLTSEAAELYASERAAELVGMRRLADGSIVPNPNAKFSVPKSVRKKIKQLTATALKDGWTEKQLRDAIQGPRIWATRSDTIARTEVAFAVNNGTVQTFKSAGVKEVDVLDGPGCLEDGHDDSQRGVSGQRWTVAKSLQHPIGHPNCVRDFAPIVES